MDYSRSQAWTLLRQHVKSEVLLKHCLAVEIAMRAYAAKFDQNVEYWGAVGLLHDIDFEKYPDDHPNHVRQILTAAGYDGQFATNVESHARDWPKERTLLQKTLLAVDELTGFVIACALVRPDKNLDNLEVKSVMKKFKDKAFARAVNRETLTTSAQDMNVDFKEHIAFVTKALAQAVKLPEYQEFPLVG
ncbi:HD domain-containing protein [Sporomusa acidovorans]|uniref:HD domain-containing protein n=1 Tax=Sporomusa acidovorans (strain ATCC 49682 / DSM 3132 / Mol) TaxID=1123286 RepID=A0ABZ3J1N7_SPOA4|nr:HD domain-containing protein [Sporomusa acidovorans]OZC15007.1 HD domain protein [Sporomusa acidovorans DSM 3132]SDE83831.1 metal dependent phosphohydrolase [Sporomusa acidovorans]